MSPEAALPDDVAGFRAGDVATFERLLARWSPYLAAVARPFAEGPDEVDELVQQAWTRIYEQRATFDGRGSLPGWMMAVCRRECLGRRRQEKARAAAEARFASAVAADPTEVGEPLFAAEARSIHAALAALPSRQRDALVLRVLEGRSTAETARAMGCAEGTVKALLHQAVQNLKNRIGGQS